MRNILLTLRGLFTIKFLLSGIFCLSLFHQQLYAAVILQYHHVSDSTPASTSISPAQFEKHLQYLADEGYQVIALSTLIDAIKAKQTLPNKTVVITFDDAYTDILTNAKPLLDKFKFPFTIFINPSVIKDKSSHFLSWSELQAMANQNVIIANHGYYHNSIARITDDVDERQWMEKQGQLIEQAETILKEKLGKSWRFYAYPYGEYTQINQQWLKANNYIAFGQHSGAVGVNTELTNIPRFPVSQPYDKLTSLKDKLKSLAFDVSPVDNSNNTIHRYGELTTVNFTVNEDDFNPSQLNCYVSGLGKEKIHWLNDNQFSITFSKPLPVGRVRVNCTAPSLSKSGRYFWYSKVWLILHSNGNWFAL